MKRLIVCWLLMCFMFMMGCEIFNFGRSQELAVERQLAADEVVKRDEAATTLLEAMKKDATAVNDAISVINDELGGLQDDLAAQIAIGEPGSQKWSEQVLLFLTSMQEDREKFQGFFEEANSKLQDVEGGWGLVEMIGTLAAGVFPPLAVTIPMIRRGRRMFEGVVDSVAAGGGVVNGKDARKAMLMIPGLKDKVTDRRVEIGDKVMEAVKVKARI